jgi:NADH:ubiquinone oxidoreductase subunit 6 (subunit J)
MWWKLGALLALTATLVFAVVPIRTHAISYDALNEVPPQRSAFGNVLANMYLTPVTVLVILCIVAGASFVAFKIVRGHW